MSSNLNSNPVLISCWIKTSSKYLVCLSLVLLSVVPSALSMEDFVRPDAVVLPENAIVPDKNLISPAPNQFTHELIRPQSFYFTGAQQAGQPDGQLPAGTRVTLLVYNGGSYCRVVDGQGLYVEIEYNSLRKL